MKWKTIIGIILVVASIMAMYLWESRFKDQVMQTEVLVPIKEIGIGDVILLSNLKTLKINPEAKIENALTAKDAEMLNGRVAKQNLVENQQLRSEYFAKREEILPEGYVHFVIPNDWIFSKSSLIGLHDKAKFYVMPDKYYLGTYQIDVVGQNSVEVIARLEDYFVMYDHVSDGKEKLLLVMEEDV